MEDIIIEFGHDPKDPKAIQSLLKIRDADLAALRKKVKLPATIHPQTDEVAQQKQEIRDSYIVGSIAQATSADRREAGRHRGCTTGNPTVERGRLGFSAPSRGY